MRIHKLYHLGTLLLVGISSLLLTGQAQAGLTSGVFYPGWAQERVSPASVRYENFSHLYHFSMFPTNQGDVLIGDIQSPEFAHAAVKAAHDHGRKIIVTIGGESFGRQFVSATKPAYRSRFIRNIVAQMTRYGYDGVDIDWEEGVIPSQYVALMKELRAALPSGKLLTTDVISDLVLPSAVAAIASAVDMVNIMSYCPGAEIDKEYTAFRRAGLPAAKLSAGIGLERNYFHSQNQVNDIIQFVRDHKMGGIFGWSLEGIDWRDSRLASMRGYYLRP